MSHITRHRARLLWRILGAALLGPLFWLLALLTLATPTAAHWLGSNLQSSVFNLDSLDLAVTTTTTQTTVIPGGLITYTITVTASGGLAEGVHLTDTLPSGTSWMTDTAHSAGLTQVSTTPPAWTIPQALTDTAISFVMIVHVPVTTPLGINLVNGVEVTSASPDANAANNAATASAVVVSGSDMQLTQTGPLTVILGSPIHYRLTYTNTGNLTATNVVVTDTLPAFIIYETASAGGVWDAGSRQVTWTLGDMGPGVAATALITGTVSATADLGGLTNHARVTATGDVDLSNNDSAWSTLIVFPTATSGEMSVSGGLSVGLPITVTATFRDGQNVLVPDGTVVTFTAPAPATITPSAVTTGGLAQAILQTTQSGSLTIMASSGAAHPTLTVSIEPGSPAVLTFVGPTSAAVGQSVTLTAWVSDTYGNAVAPIPVQFIHAGVGQLSATSVNTILGRAATTLSSQASGQAQVTATAGSRQTTANLRFTPLAPASLSLDILGTASVGNPIPMQATLRDLYQNTVSAGHQVRFSIISGTASLGSTTPTTDATGVASTTLTSNVAGAVVVQAQSGAVTANKTVSIAAGPAVRLDVSASPGSVAVDGGQTQLTVRAVDQSGNVVTNRTGSVNLNFTSALTGTFDTTTPSLANGVTRAMLTAPNSFSAEGLVVQASQAGLASGSVSIPLQTADVTIRVEAVPRFGLGSYMVPGQELTYAISYSNTGQAIARDVTIENTLLQHFINPQVTLPTGATTVRQPVNPGEAWRWQVGSLGPGQRGQITVRGRLNPTFAWSRTQRLQTDATISTSTTQRVANQTDFATLGVDVYTADLTLEVTPPDPSILQPGYEIPYRIFLSNLAPAEVRQARITVTLPVSATFSYWEEKGPSGQPTPPGYIRLINPLTGLPAENCTGECVWLYDTPSPNPAIASTGSNSHILLRLRVADGARPGQNALRLITRISSPIFDHNSPNNFVSTLSDLYGVNLTADLGVLGFAVAGDTLVVSAEATNRGRTTGTINATASNIMMTMTLPSQVEFVSATVPVTPTAGVLSWFFPGDMTPDNSRRVNVTVRALSNLPAGAVFSHTLQVSSTTPEPFRADNYKVSGTRIIPDRPERVTMDDATITLPVDGSAVLSAQVFDRNNNAVPNVDVSFVQTPVSPALFTVTPPTRRTDVTGSLTTTLVAGTRLGEASVQARITVGAQTYTDIRTVRVVAGSPFTPTLSISRTLAVGAMTPFAATFTDRYGNPVADGTVVTLTTNLGGFEVGNQIQQIAYAYTQAGRIDRQFLTSTRAGIARVSACAGGYCDVKPVSIIPGAPAVMSLSLSQADAPAGDGSIEVVAGVGDQFNNPVLDGIPVRFEMSGCPTASAQPGTAYTLGGQATASIVVGTRVCQGMVTGRVGLVSQSDTFRVTPAAPYWLRVSAPVTVLASGIHTGTINILLTDVYSNGISGPVSLGLSPELGTLDHPVVQTLNGAGSAVLTAPRRLGTTLLTAQAGPLTHSTPIEFVAGPIAAITLVPSRPALRADNESQSPLILSARDAYSNPISSQITVISNLGTTVTPSSGPLTNGLFATTIRAGSVAGTALLTATVDSRVQTFPIRLLAGPPFVVIPSTSRVPARLVADGLDNLLVSARLLDKFGNAVENGTPVTFTLSSPLGTFRPGQGGTAGGIVSTTLTAGTTLGTAQLKVDAGTRNVTRSVEFTVGPPSQVSLALSTSRIMTTREVTATIYLTATVVDVLGRPVTPGTAVRFETERGVFQTGSQTMLVSSDANGRAYATLQTLETEGSVRLTASAGSVRGGFTLLIGDHPYRIMLPQLTRAPSVTRTR